VALRPDAFACSPTQTILHTKKDALKHSALVL
jgi:hypothetical protein